jgi:hypothetical protein
VIMTGIVASVPSEIGRQAWHEENCPTSSASLGLV